MSGHTNLSTRTRRSGSTSSQSEEINQPPSSQQAYSRPSMWPDLDFLNNPSLENSNVLRSPVHESSSSFDVHRVHEGILSTIQTFLETHPAEMSLTPTMLDPEFDFSPVLSGVDINACPAPINMESARISSLQVEESTVVRGDGQLPSSNMNFDQSDPYWKTSSFETQNTEFSEFDGISSLQIKESTVVRGDGQLPSSNMNFDQSDPYWKTSSFETQNTEFSEFDGMSSLQVKESTVVCGDGQLPSSNLNFDQSDPYWNTSSFETQITEFSEFARISSLQVKESTVVRGDGQLPSSNMNFDQSDPYWNTSSFETESTESSDINITDSRRRQEIQQTLLTGNEGAKSRSSKSTALLQTLLTGHEGSKFRSSKSTALQQTLLTGNEGAKFRSSESAKIGSSESTAIQRNVKRKDSSLASGTHSGMNQTVRGYKKVAKIVYVCDVCGKQFASKGGLKNHSVLHVEKPQLECRHCGKQFNRELNLVRHLAPPNNATAHKCARCEKVFSCPTMLNLHMKSHSVQFYHCRYCSFCSLFQESYLTHMQTEHN
ncbi:hypothetical protein CEXT_515481 [Caerostris extrusa]|uniref:C2H2-type domain-containing protein n=1 Tax=Caerostris extrusa TaxID=172846 RepID=A0AAV4Q7L3_CAEEX|nr:hypothetical protein CEXT_515481 [Caerostris extrusa]